MLNTAWAMRGYDEKSVEHVHAQKFKSPALWSYQWDVKYKHVFARQTVVAPQHCPYIPH